MPLVTATAVCSKLFYVSTDALMSVASHQVVLFSISLTRILSRSLLCLTRLSSSLRTLTYVKATICVVVSCITLFQKYAKIAKAPLLINACETDGQWPKEKQDRAIEVLKDFAPGFSQPYFEGCTHGFGVSIRLSNAFILLIPTIIFTP